VELIVLLLVVLGVVWWIGSHRRPAPPVEVGPVGWVAGADWRVARPLARFEVRRVLRHPAFLVGVVLTPLMLLASGIDETTWWRVSPNVALALVPLGWATILAVDLVALQSRRTGADELMAALPAPAPVRTTALLATAPAAALVSALLATAWVALRAAGIFGGPLAGRPQVTEIASGVVIVAGSVTVGVAVARWLPHVVFGVLAAVATIVLQARFLDVTTWPWDREDADPLRFLAFLVPRTSVGRPGLELRPAGWHLLYLVALVVLVAGVALLRDGRARPTLAVLGAAVLVAVGAGWRQTRPPSTAEVAAMVARLEQPADVWTCVAAATVRYCHDEVDEERVDSWRARTESVLALVPPAVAARPLAVTSRVPTVTGDRDCGSQLFVWGLPAEVAARVDVDAVWPADRDVHPGTNRFPCGGDEVAELFTAVQVGAWAVGLPPSPHGLDQRCSASGQARAVVALWLGAAATPDGADRLRRLVREAGGGLVLTFGGWDDPPMWGARFAVDDALLAAALADRPAAEVAAAVAGAWAVVVDPATPSSGLVDLLALAPADGTTALPVSTARPSAASTCP
jgi:hypothetical protein